MDTLSFRSDVSISIKILSFLWGTLRAKSLRSCQLVPASRFVAVIRNPCEGELVSSSAGHKNKITGYEPLEQIMPNIDDAGT